MRKVITIQRIANGYNVCVPSYPMPFNPVERAEEPQKVEGNFIPQEKNVFFFDNLQGLFDFLTKIETNPQPSEDGYAYALRPATTLGDDI